MKRTFHIFSLAIIFSLLISAVGFPLISAQADPVWQYVGAVGFSIGEANYTSLALHNSTPYVAFQDVANSSKASVMKFNGTV